MREESLISLRQVMKRRHRLAIGPLNVEFPSGCVTAIVGMNGSGKSSMMAMLLGILHPDDGEIRIEGRPYEVSQDIVWKRRLGYVPEHPNPEDDAQTMEKIANQLSYWYPTWDWNYYQELIVRYEVDPRTKLNKMSKGMRRKAELILAIAHRPEILLLDEPTSGLDPISWRMMIEDLQYMLDDGKHTIIIATHVVEEVKRLADYILIMHQGKVLRMVEKDTLFDAWKEYWLEGVSAEDLEGAPGLAVAVQEQQVVRVIAHDSQKLEQFFLDHQLSPIRRRIMPLDEVMYYQIRLEDEGRGRVR